MSRKTECPACNSWTSSIYDAFQDGEPCPFCQLPAEAAKAINTARERNADEQLIKRALAAELRAAEMEAELRRLRTRLANIKHTVNAELGDEEWRE